MKLLKEEKAVKTIDGVETEVLFQLFVEKDHKYLDVYLENSFTETEAQVVREEIERGYLEFGNIIVKATANGKTGVSELKGEFIGEPSHVITKVEEYDLEGEAVLDLEGKPDDK